jgi:hypothetical protein
MFCMDMAVVIFISSIYSRGNRQGRPEGKIPRAGREIFQAGNFFFQAGK